MIPEDRGLLNTMDEVADTVSVKLKGEVGSDSVWQLVT